MSLLDPTAYYSGFHIDHSAKTIEVLAEDCDKISLIDVWREHFSNFSKVNVCLSGGIDSQFVLSMLSKLEKNITVYIFSFVWEDCVFNAPDVLHAIRYCNRYNHAYKNIEIDCKAFFESTSFVEYCKRYKTTSPQIALQLKMIDHIDNEYPIFLGGDVPFLEYDFNQKRAILMGISYQPLITHAFLNYSEQNNKLVIKDLLRLCPKSHAISYKEFLKTTKKHKLLCTNVNGGSGQTQPLRVLYYQDIGGDLIPPLLKNTGFEILKMHMAKKTGIYNQYDISYRYPLQQLLSNEDWYNIRYTLKMTPFLDRIKQEFENFCQTTPDIKPIELYNFIL